MVYLILHLVKSFALDGELCEKSRFLEECQFALQRTFLGVLNGNYTFEFDFV